MYPPVTPATRANPPVNPEKTGSPKAPKSTYIHTAIVPLFAPKTAAAIYTAKDASEIGIGPTGIENGEKIHIIAANTPTSTISLVFIILCLPPLSLIFSTLH